MTLSRSIKILNIDDLLLIESLLLNQTHVFAWPKKSDTNKKYLWDISNWLKSQTEHSFLRLYGIIENNELIAMSGGFFGKKMPIWTLAYVHIRQGHSSKYRTTSGALINSLIEYAEGQNIYRFNYATGLRNFLVYNPHKNISRISKISSMAKRYDYFIDAVIKKNTKPTFDYHWLLMGQQLHDMDMMIRSAELKFEFRPKLDSQMDQYGFT